MDQWTEIRHLSKMENLSQREISRRLGISRKTVAKALRDGKPPVYQREPGGSKVDPYVPAIRGLLLEHPRLKATVIAERVGYGKSSTVFRDKVASIRAEMGIVDPADRLLFLPGEQAQFDLWLPKAVIEETGRKHPVLTLVACWSRFLMAIMLPSRQCGDILAGMNILLEQLGGLPQRLLWDNESGIVHARRLIPQASAWAGAMGAAIRLARPADPETKGRIERANGYLGSSFEPARRFETIDDFNHQLTDWLDTVANQRIVRATNARPADLIIQERAALASLPLELPAAETTNTIRLPRDYYVRFDSNDYSVNPTVIGKVVTVHGSLTRVWVTCEGREVADHQRCFQSHQTITDPAHVEQAARLRSHFQAETAKAANRPAARMVLVENRNLAVYDQLYRQEAA